jgi:hypothetical protein
MQTLRHSSLGWTRRLRSIAKLIACGADIVGCLVSSTIVGACLYAVVVPVTPASAKMQSTANYSTVLEGDRRDRTTGMRGWTAGPMKTTIVGPEQKLLIGCEPAFSKLGTRDRKAARCLT